MDRNELFQYGSAVNELVKEAAYGVGGQQPTPSTPYQNASGLYDPNSALAGYSQLSETRSDINARTILDGQISGTNLLPYRNVMNEGYQTVNTAMNVPMGKAASEEDWVDAMEDTGLFEDVNIVPDEEAWATIVHNAQVKSASDTDVILGELVESGIMDQIDPELTPYFYE
jgi:hypothetical protein